jgi:putative glutamine amidotransferase
MHGPGEDVTGRTPIVGVTRCSRLDDYVTSVERTGARVRILEVSESPRSLVGEVDALLLTGGGDVDPSLYREDRHPSVSDAEPGRDEFEIDLARRAVDGDLPLLGICRGAQVLNVACGGALIQDIPSAFPCAGAHDVEEPAAAHAHDVEVVPGSVLRAALGSAVGPTGHCAVNSRHHQAVSRPGTGLVATATAPDGVIEAVERPDARFCVGVQWHPENFCHSGAFDPLFAALVRAARERLADRPPGARLPSP